MSQITCCPACGTMFRVVADQLRVSEGWVRCGHCTEVFDATEQMQDGAAAVKPDAGSAVPTGPAVAQAADASGEVEPIDSGLRGDGDARDEHAGAAERDERGAHDTVVPLQPLLEPDGWAVGDGASDHLDDRGHDEAPTDSRLERPPAPTQTPHADAPVPPRFQPSVIDAEAGPALKPSRARDALADRSEDDAAPSQVPSGWRPSGADQGYPPFELRRADSVDDEPDSFFTPPDVNSGWTAPEEKDEPQAQDLSFIRDARRRAFWQRPLMRLAVAAVALLLGVMLAAQYAVYDRNRLVALHPQLAPVIHALCRPVGCSIGPLQRIDAIAIDSSAFNKLRPEAYRLSVTLKNLGAAAVAMPALELTLTDAQDQPVLRRVLAPRELGAAADVIAGNGEWSGVVSLTVAANGNAERIAGYRLLAFYP
jgi:predicted Zn finger-like uncharacterized protein